ncbi:arginase family protein [Geodermatophilus sp. SYSU D01062]
MTGSPARPPVHLLRVPFDSGHEERRMGAGPTALARGGAADRLRGRGHAVTEQVVRPGDAGRAELTTASGLCRAVASAVATVRSSGAVLLSGNRGTTLGVLAGLSGSGRRIGPVRLDAHGDVNTPDDDTGGFLDGQGLAVVVGRCWRALAARVPGFVPLAERDVVLAGARESLTLASHDPALDPAGRLRATALDLLEEVCARATPLPS